MFFILPQAWDKEKILNPHEDQTSDLWIPHSDVLNFFTELKTFHLSYSMYIKNCYQYKCASSLKGPMNSEKLSSLYPL